LSEPEEKSHRLRVINRCIRIMLWNQGVFFKEIAVAYDPADETITGLNCITTSEQDIWLLTDAHSHAARYLAGFAGRKFAYVIDHKVFKCNPGEIFDGLFVISEWSKQWLISHLPILSERVFVCGFPYFPFYTENMKGINNRRLIIFNQLFCQENLNILELYLGSELIRQGFRVIHLSPPGDEPVNRNHAEILSLIREGIKRGIEFVLYPNLTEYYQWLSQAGFTVTTPLCCTDFLGILEAATHGAFPLAPNCGLFPEFLALPNLYSPYNLEQICHKLRSPVTSTYRFNCFSPVHVFARYARIMGVN
jgi:hypothetical protein